jgi:FMNH2-dependent dimethyl sulfone monooxygenase
MYGGWLRDVSLEEKEISYEYAKRAALKAEEIGIESIWVPDHLLNPIKGENINCLEAWTTLTAIGSVTKRVELFHTTLCQGFRHPAVLAKMSVTLFDISNGRFRLNLGAGWFKREFEAYGIPWHEHNDRIDRAREQLEIIRGLWTEDIFSYKGRYYEIKNGVLEPKPKKKIPIWWTGESEKSRELTADIADGWLIGNSTIEQIKEKIVDMEKRLKERRRNEIQYAVPGHFFVDETDEKALKKLENLLLKNSARLNRILETGFVGCPETVAEKIEDVSKIGINYVIFQMAPTLEALDILKEEVLSLL